MTLLVSLRHIALAGAFAAGSAVVGVPAHSADLPAPPPPPMMMPVVNSWSGFYLGGHVGYGWGDFDFKNPSITATSPVLALPGGGLTLGLPIERQFEGDGFLGGGQVGVNAQWGGLVVGIEADVSRTNIDGRVRSTAGPFLLPVVGAVTTAEGASADLEWLGTVRGRLGWAFDRLLVYGTGGVAFGRVETKGDITATSAGQSLSFFASDRQTHVGWAAGAGLEGMITPNLSAKVEYLYADLGWARHEGPGVVTASPGIAALIPAGTSAVGGGDFKVEVHSVKVGLNYRFNLLGR